MRSIGKINVKLAQVLQQKQITRNKLCSLTGIKYEVIDRYYKNQNIDRVDLDFLAKVCFALNCEIEDLLEYEPNK